MTFVIGYGGGGGKGGGGSARSAQEDPDSLRSNSYARVLDLISEGEIEGLVNGLKSVYLDETPLQNPDGSYNFSGVSLDWRNGTQSQTYIPGNSDIENTTSVGVQLKATTPFVRTITDTTIDAVRLTVGIPQLTKQSTSTGDISGTSVRLKIEVSNNGGPFSPLTIGFGSSSLTPGVQSPWDMDAATINVNWTHKLQKTSVTRCAQQNDRGYCTRYETTQETKPTSAVIRIWGAKNGGAPTVIGTINVTGQTDGTVTQHSLTKSLSVGKWLFTADIQSGEGTVAIGSITANAHVAKYDTITGKTTSRYQRSYRIDLPSPGPWTLRVSRLTDDSTSSALQNATWIDTITEIVEAKLTYPNSAIVRLAVDASQFSSVPARAYDMKLLKIKVPSNYDPITRTYTGSWDGTFVTKWSDNPAWCFYDMITADRYGLGQFVDAEQVDKWVLYQIGQYCDELVPNMIGGQEPRFTCNLYLQSREEAYKVLNDMASIFRGVLYWSSGAVTAVQDAPSDPAYLYTPANVVDGLFTYSGSSAKARHTVALVSWNDPEDFYRQKVQYVEDTDAIARYGVVQTQVTAIGCTSRSQAQRVGKWLLLSERLESEVVTFKTGLDGMIARPGQIIKVADPARAGVRFGGRVHAATSTSLTIDAPVSLTAGSIYTVSCLKADGTTQDATVIGTGSSTAALALTAPFAELPAVGSIWVIQNDAVESQLFRVVTVQEEAQQLFTITALSHYAGKYVAVENDTILEKPSISAIDAVPATPANLTVTESLYLSNGVVKNRLDISWEHSNTATQYAVQLHRSNANPSPEVLTVQSSIEIDDVAEDVYTISVAPVNGIGGRGTPAFTTYTVQGKKLPPSNVTAFSAHRVNGQLAFTWNGIPDLDIDVYEVRQGVSWLTGTTVAKTPNTNVQIDCPRGGQFMIKALDTSGNYSKNEAAVIATESGDVNVVLSVEEATRGWHGTYSSSFYLPGTVRDAQWGDWDRWDAPATWADQMNGGGVVLTGGTPWSAFGQSWSTYTDNWLFAKQTLTNGSYITEPIDVGYVTTARIYIDPAVSILPNSSLTWNSFDQPWTNYASPVWSWQGRTDSIAASYDISTSLDGTTWTDWTPFVIGGYTARYVKIRANLTANDPQYMPMLTGLKVRVDVPDRVVRLQNQAVLSGGTTFAFNPPFVGIDTVQVTLQSANTGDTFKVTGKSITGVTVNCYNSSGVAIAGVVDIDAFGYGEKT